MFLSYTGRDERYFDRFVVSPDNQYLVFLGRNGYMLLVSNKVRVQPMFDESCSCWGQLCTGHLQTEVPSLCN